MGLADREAHDEAVEGARKSLRQLTVYLRLAGGTVPALYGPSADDARWS